MRTLFAVVALVAAFISTPAHADDQYLGTITSTGTSVTNATTATPFYAAGFGVNSPTTPPALRLAVQCDAAAYLKVVSTSSGTVTAANGIKAVADQIYDLDLVGGPKLWLAAISVSGTANCKVFARKTLGWLWFRSPSPLALG